MQILQTILVVIFFLSCAVLMFLILIQSGKGGSLGIMGGGGSSSTFGSSTVDVVEKATWYGIGAFIMLAVVSAVAFADSGPKLNLPGAETPTKTEETAPATTGNPAPVKPAQAPAVPRTSETPASRPQAPVPAPTR